MQIIKKSNVREYSYEILLGVFYNGELLNESINECFDNNDLNEKDKSYIRNECAGLIEKCDEIDSTIKKHLKNKNKKLDKELQLVLRLGCYELMYLDKVPTFATINECVNLIKKTKLKSLSGFVNAVLRNISREIRDNGNKDTSSSISKRCYFRIYNDKELEVLKELDEKSINYKLYDGALSFEYAKVYYANNYKDIIDTNSFKSGFIMISDASSIYLTDKLAEFIKTKRIGFDSKNIKLLDVCAAPGGKILGLIDLIHSDYIELCAEARDLSLDKINKISENVDRLKVTGINLSTKDASVYDESENGKYDLVICDVPCTGLGVVGKKPDIKLHFTKSKLDSLVGLQKKIISVSSKYLRTGGILSYSTCTTTQEENEDVIKEFIEDNKGFCKIFEKRIEVNDENMADGFYMCFLEKN